MVQEKAKRTRRNFTPEYKKKVIRHLKSSNLRKVDICKMYDISLVLLNRWMKDFEDSVLPSTPDNESYYREAFFKLKLEHEDLLEENTILKKALSIVSSKTK